MAKMYLSELQAQLDLVKAKLAEIHIPRGPLVSPPSPELLERRKKLVARKKDLEEKILFYEP